MTSIDPSRVMEELQTLRRVGLPGLRLGGHGFPALLAAAHAAQGSTDGPDGAQIEKLLRTAVSGLGDPQLQRAANHGFGLDPGQSHARSMDRRKAAAATYRVSAERFRKVQEPLLLQELTGRILEAVRLREETPDVDEEETPSDCLGPWETRLAQGIASSLVSDGQAEEALKSVLARATSRVGSSGPEAD
ncbi:hypothetical protein [Streptomyces sp. NPDC094472]|uniref:hypothetical protein n=1 Tax=Streptomyces sp. NPDC094472 TaxID=3155080 RepID=UPI00332DE16A